MGKGSGRAKAPEGQKIGRFEDTNRTLHIILTPLRGSNRGTVRLTAQFPTTYVVGYILPPLRR
jgi:hypothetical protein